MRVWSVARQVGEAGWSPDWLGAPHGHLWRASRVNEDANHVPDRLTMSMRRLLSGLQRRASARARKLFVAAGRPHVNEEFVMCNRHFEVHSCARDLIPIRNRPLREAVFCTVLYGSIHGCMWRAVVVDSDSFSSRLSRRTGLHTWERLVHANAQCQEPVGRRTYR